MSVPGQTVGVSVFTDYLIRDLNIPRNLLSLSYLAGTIGSALLMTRAGKLYDSFGGRSMGVAVCILLGAALLYLSFSLGLTNGIRRLFPGVMPVIAPFLVTTIGFFLIRFLGQGSLTLLTRNMVMEWFEKRRGIANAVVGMSVSFGFSYAPRLLDLLIRRFTWQGAWRVMAFAIGGIFSLIAFIFFRRQPEDHGLVPDGGKDLPVRVTHVETTGLKQATLQEARKTYKFWIYTLALTMSALVVTAFTFHIVSIFGMRELQRGAAVGIFLPSSFIAIACQFAGSWISDFIKLKYILIVQLLGLILLCSGVIFLKPGAPVIVVIIGLGINQGLFGVTGNIAWVRFFGRKHLGAISGFSTAWLVAGSAVGPYLFSVALDAAGTYNPAVIASLAVIVVLFIGAFKD